MKYQVIIEGEAILEIKDEDGDELEKELSYIISDLKDIIDNIQIKEIYTIP